MRDEYTRLPRLYVKEALCEGSEISLSKEQAHFLSAVVRARAGDKLRVFNEMSGEYLCVIKALARRTCTLTAREQLREPCSAPDIWLLFAPIKRERNRFIVEKATELGAALIWPVQTARTTSKIRIDKMTAHIVEAAEQTERLDLPLVQNTEKLEEVLKNWDEARTLIFADEAGGALPAASALAEIQTPCALLIGPEGGFTKDERELLRSKSYVVPISLGPRILRADTAVLAALAVWQAVSGDWQDSNSTLDISKRITK